MTVPTHLLRDELVRRLIQLGYADPTTGALTGTTVDAGAVGEEVLAAETVAAALEALGLTEEATQTTIVLEAVPPGTAVSTGDSKVVFIVPAALNGANIISSHTYSTTAGTTGTQDCQVHRVRSGSSVDVLTTKMTQDSTEKSSRTAATPPVINTSNDDLATDDELHLDVDVVQTTPAQGLFWIFVVEIPLA